MTIRGPDFSKNESAVPSIFVRAQRRLDSRDDDLTAQGDGSEWQQDRIDKIE
jgi:hypothetical protein